MEEIPQEYLDEYLALHPSSLMNQNIWMLLIFSDALLLVIRYLNKCSCKLLYTLSFFVAVYNIATIILRMKKEKHIIYFLYVGFSCALLSVLTLMSSIGLLYYYNNFVAGNIKIIYITIYIICILFPTVINVVLLKNGFYFKITREYFKIYKILFFILCLGLLIFEMVIGSASDNMKMLYVSMSTLMMSVCCELGIHNFYKYYLLKKGFRSSYICEVVSGTKKTKKKYKINNKEEEKIIEEVLDNSVLKDFKSLDENVREGYILDLKSKGMSMKKISEITGISYYMVRKICNNNK